MANTRGKGIITTNKAGHIVIIIGGSDLDADWLKNIDDGKHQKDDLKAHDTAEKLNKEREGK